MNADQRAYRIVIGRVITHLRGPDRTQKDLAQSIGVAQSTLSRIERGEIAPDGWQIRQLAIAFELTPSELQEHFDEAFESAEFTASKNTSGALDPWEVALGTAGIMGVSALIGFALAALFETKDNEDD